MSKKIINCFIMVIFFISLLFIIGCGLTRPITSIENSGLVSCVRFSNDTKMIAASYYDGNIRFWNPLTGELMKVFYEPDGEVDVIDFSNDNDKIASAHRNNSKIKIWNLETGKVIFVIEGNMGNIKGVSFSPDSTKIVSAGIDGTIKLWNIESGSEIWTKKFEFEMRTVVFSTDGKYIICGGKNGIIYYLDSTNGQEINSLSGHTNLVTSLKVSPNGLFLASASVDETVKVWDIKKKELLYVLTGHGFDVRSVDFVDDLTVVSGGGGGKVIIWKLNSLKNPTIWRAGDGYSIRSIDVSSQGEYIASSNDGNIKIWKFKK